MNITKELLSRIEERSKETKTPCKLFKTEDRAQKAAETMARAASDYFTMPKHQPARPARYIVLYVPSLDRWTYCIDMTELIGRATSTGGYLGFCKDTFNY